MHPHRLILVAHAPGSAPGELIASFISLHIMENELDYGPHPPPSSVLKHNKSFLRTPPQDTTSGLLLLPFRLARKRDSEVKTPCDAYQTRRGSVEEDRAMGVHDMPCDHRA